MKRKAVAVILAGMMFFGQSALPVPGETEAGGAYIVCAGLSDGETTDGAEDECALEARPDPECADTSEMRYGPKSGGAADSGSGPVFLHETISALQGTGDAAVEIAEEWNASAAWSGEGADGSGAAEYTDGSGAMGEAEARGAAGYADGSGAVEEAEEWGAAEYAEISATADDTEGGGAADGIEGSGAAEGIEGSVAGEGTEGSVAGEGLEGGGTEESDESAGEDSPGGSGDGEGTPEGEATGGENGGTDSSGEDPDSPEKVYRVEIETDKTEADTLEPIRVIVRVFGPADSSSGGETDPAGGEDGSGGEADPAGGDGSSGDEQDPAGGAGSSGGEADPAGGAGSSGGETDPAGGEDGSGGETDPAGGAGSSGGEQDPAGGEGGSGGEQDPAGGDSGTGGEGGTEEGGDAPETVISPDELVLFPDLEGRPDWSISLSECLEDGSFAETVSYESSGTYRMAARARIGEETFLSGTVETAVSASTGERIHPVLPETLPTAVGAEDTLSFRVDLPEHADYMALQVLADVQGEAQTLFAVRSSEASEEISIGPDVLGLLEEGTHITVSLRAAGRGYEPGSCALAVIRLAAAPQVSLTLPDTPVRVNEPTPVTVTSEDERPVTAVRLRMDEAGEWSEKVFTPGDLSEDGTLTASLTWRNEGTHLLYAEVSYDEWEDEFSVNPAVLDSLAWEKTEPVRFLVSSEGETGAFSLAVKKDELTRGETLELVFSESEHADRYGAELARWSDEKEEWNAVASVPWTGYGEVIPYPTWLLAEGRYRVRGRALGAGYTERLSDDYAYFDILPSALSTGELALSPEKVSCDTLEAVRVFLYAPGASRIELWPDYENNKEWKLVLDGEAGVETVSYAFSGIYHLYASACYEDSTGDGAQEAGTDTKGSTGDGAQEAGTDTKDSTGEGAQEAGTDTKGSTGDGAQEAGTDTKSSTGDGAQKAASAEADISVTASFGKALKIEPPVLPAYLDKGDSLSFELAGVQGAAKMELTVSYEADDEGSEVLLYENGGRARLMAVDIPPEHLEGIEERRYVRIRAFCAAPGYEADRFYAEIPCLFPGEETELALNSEKCLVNQTLEATVCSPDGERTVRAVRIWNDETKDFRTYEGDALEEDGSLYTELSFWNPGLHMVYAQTQYEGTGEEKSAWHTSNVLLLPVSAYGDLAVFSADIDRESVVWADTFAVTYTRARHADYYWLEVERLEGEAWAPFGTMGLVDEPGTVNVSTLSMTPGRYRMIGMSKGLGYVGRESDSGYAELEVTESELEEGSVLLTVSKNELDTREDVSYSVYAPGACSIDIYPDHGNNPDWVERIEGEVYEQTTSYSHAGEYEMVAVARYEADGPGTASEAQRMTITSSTGKALQLELPDLPVYIRRGDSLEYTIKKPKYAEDLLTEVRVAGAETPLFSGKTQSGFINVSLPEETFRALEEPGVIRILFDASARGYDADTYVAEIPFVTPGTDETLTVGESALVNEPLSLRITSTDERKVKAVRVWWDEQGTFPPERVFAGSELGEEGELPAIPGYERPGMHVIYAQVSYDGEETGEERQWSATVPVLISAGRLGQAGSFSSSLAQAIAPEGDGISLTYTESEKADRYYAELYRKNESSGVWEYLGTDGFSDSAGTVTINREDLTVGTYRISAYASGVGYEKKRADNAPLDLRILPRSDVDRALEVLARLEALARPARLADEPLIEAAKKAYASLTEEQKSFVTEAALARLAGAEEDLVREKEAAREAARIAAEEKKRAEAKALAEKAADQAHGKAEAAAKKPGAKRIQAAKSAIREAQKAIRAARALKADVSAASLSLSLANKALKAAQAEMNRKITFGNAKVAGKLNRAGTKTGRIVIKKGRKLRLKARSSDGAPLSYASNKKKVATVSTSGVITAKKAGKAAITVKSGIKKVKVLIRVK